LSPKDPSWWLAPARRIPLIALAVLILDQASKAVILRVLGFSDERVLLEGFFKLVHWGNTGSAFSMFQGRNGVLALISIAAIFVLYLTRHHFEAHTLSGQVALGLIFGGIAGNLIDRVMHGHVIDFIYFYVIRRDGSELGFPAFNVADSAICIGVGLLFVVAWLNPGTPQADKPRGDTA
jgi:signal peptidase II